MSRDDKYFAGEVTCRRGVSGFSRPALRWVSDTQAELWFDASGCVKKVPFSFDAKPDVGRIVSELPSREQKYGALDIDLPRLINNQTATDENVFMIQGGSGVKARIKVNGIWRDSIEITKSGQGSWDAGSHGSPWLFLNRASCRPRIYFAGFDVNYNATIAVALPPTDETFNFSVCRIPEDQAAEESDATQSLANTLGGLRELLGNLQNVFGAPK